MMSVIFELLNVENNKIINEAVTEFRGTSTFSKI